MTLFPMVYSFVLAALTLGLGCAMFGLQLHWSTVPLSIPVMLLALLAFLPFGLLFAALTVVIKQGTVGTSWVIALLSIIGGLYFPVSLLPDWLQTASKLQPFTAGDEPAAPPARRHAADGELAATVAAEARAVRGGAAARPRSWPCPARSGSASGAARSSSTDGERIALTTDPQRRLCCSPRRSRVPQNVVYRSFPSETVVLNLQTGQYHGLNATAGTDARRARRPRAACATPSAALAEIYGQPQDVIEQDLCELCRSLLERGLIEIDGSPAP